MMSMSQDNNKKNNQQRPEDNENEEFDWGKNFRQIGLIVIVAIMMVIFWQFFQRSAQPQANEIKYTDFKLFVEAGNVAQGEIRISGTKKYVFFGTFTEAQQVEVPGRGEVVSQENFITNLPFVDNQFEKWLEEHEVVYSYVYEDTSVWDSLLSFVPWIALIAIWIFFMRRMTSGGGAGGRGIFSFGKSRARLVDPEKNRVTFADVAGADEAKEELEEVVEFLRAPEKFSSLGGKIPKGVLLVGPPGTGKTLLARAVAGEADVPFFSISGADFVEMFVGVGASRVRDLFEQGRKQKPCIIFIDELDAVGRQRGAGLGGGHDEREQTLNQLLVEMDGFDHTDSVILIAATNRPDVLDSALMRPGRFDRQVVVGKPDIRGRMGILEVHTRKIPLASDVDLAVVAKSTPGSSGADLANIINEAALMAARRSHKKVTMDDIEEARDKVFMGPERRSLIMSDYDKKVVAYHEAGHALVGMMLTHSKPVHKVTIIPRGMALGVTHTLPEKDTYNFPKEYFLDELAVFMGGRVAEMVTFGRATTGAGSDIERATQIARKMVTEWGMSDRLGTLSFGTPQEEVFLGREIANSRNYSERTAQIIDEEISAIVKNAYHQAEKIVKENFDGLQALANGLLERETLVAVEIEKVLREAGVEIPEKAPEVQFAERFLKKKSARFGRGTKKTNGQSKPENGNGEEPQSDHQTSKEKAKDDAEEGREE
jgi:cell division protease FtsH